MSAIKQVDKILEAGDCEETGWVYFTDGDVTLCRMIGKPAKGNLVRLRQHRKAKAMKCFCSRCRGFSRGYWGTVTKL